MRGLLEQHGKTEVVQKEVQLAGVSPQTGGTREVEIFKSRILDKGCFGTEEGLRRGMGFFGVLIPLSAVP